MYSWNFDEVVLVGDCLYFDNVPRKVDGVTDMDMYVYDIAKNELTMIEMCIRDRFYAVLKINSLYRRFP